MTIYWQNTRSPIHLFKRAYEGQGLAEHISENALVDPKILADGLRVPHLNPWAVAAYQRRLGVRPIKGR
jgi:hypothetical protein